MPSMLFCPVAIPANRDATLTAAFAPAEPGTLTCSVTRSYNPTLSAMAITGTRPAADTRFGSSKSTETLCRLALSGAPVSG
jgi:hypothetical protein